VPGTYSRSCSSRTLRSKKSIEVPAHQNQLSCVSLNADGTLLATSSEKGTIVRIFDTSSGKRLQEFRRGADRAEIFCITFNYNSQWVAVSSDKGTVHIFSLEGREGEAGGGAAPRPAAAVVQADRGDVKKNPKSRLSFLGGFSEIFNPDLSFSMFRVPGDTRAIVAFGADKHSIIVITADGRVYKATFDPNRSGAECVQESVSKFIKDAPSD